MFAEAVEGRRIQDPIPGIVRTCARLFFFTSGTRYGPASTAAAAAVVSVNEKPWVT